MPFIFQAETISVAAIGAFAGAIELIGRYRDAPLRALRTSGALVYIGINIIAAVVGLLLLQTLGSDLLQDIDPVKREIKQILIAGFGSIALLRATIFKLRLNETDISVGPALLLDVLLASADRGVDRRRGSDRANEVAEVMKDVSFDRAITILPPFCLTLMQRLTQQEQEKISEQTKLIQDQPSIDPHVRSLMLGLLLMNLVGLDVLRGAVKQLAPHIKYTLPPPKRTIEPAALIGMLDEVRRSLGRSIPEPDHDQHTS